MTMNKCKPMEGGKGEGRGKGRGRGGRREGREERGGRR